MPTTTNYGWTKPTPGGNVGTWGGVLNTLFDEIDTDLKGVDDRLAQAETDISTLQTDVTAIQNGATFQLVAPVQADVFQGEWVGARLSGTGIVGYSTTDAINPSLNPVDIYLPVQGGDEIISAHVVGALSSGSDAASAQLIEVNLNTGAETVITGSTVTLSASFGMDSSASFSHTALVNRAYIIRVTPSAAPSGVTVYLGLVAVTR